MSKDEKTISFQTPRCLIRPFQSCDIDAFMEYRNNAEWMRYQGFKGLSREAYELALLSPQNLKNGMQLAIADAVSGRLIGDLYLKEEQATLWAGYTITPACAGQGLAYEVMKALTGWAGQQGYTAIQADVEKENTASIRLLDKLTFIRVPSDNADEFLYRLQL